MKIINLDSLMAEDQKIILGGKEWIIPGEMLFDDVMKLIGYQQKIQSDPLNFDLWEAQLDIIFKVFKKRQPEITMDELREVLTSRQVGQLVGILISSIGEVELSEEEKKRMSELQEENQKE